MLKIYPKKIKKKVRNLRSQGWSLGEIKRKTGIPKNTLSGWIKDIKLTKSQIRRIKEKEIACAAMGRTLVAKLLREKIEKWKDDTSLQFELQATGEAIINGGADGI